ncbi:MAG: NAD(P)(+) transhydrogenase [Deltaproteobacteria bacterium RIFOXYA12_FULL_58_15]|nr:MAG: NAD(P)(+) transhydrogenase [Deltaproteobacteria bacterium RIFOXYA12_FULL_58_15]OGR13777.1 MAG: NAD(P)(+) transhydrogenase [Deltaproteobacteria bacterium RIFOXYB12_FULL_58_9]
MSNYDVVILGAGPAGERAAIQAAKIGKRVALIEREHVVGGTGVVWGAIPSKTLRESASFVRSITSRKLDGIPVNIGAEISIADFMYRERMVVQRELELINKALDRWAVDLIHGQGRILDEHRVVVENRHGQSRIQLSADFIVIATGSSPNHPEDVDFDTDVVFDSATILKLPRMPRSIIVLGAGVIGVEYAAIFAALGLQTTLVDTRPQMLPFVDREIIEILQRELRKLHMVIIHDDHYARVERIDGKPPSVRVHTREGNTVEADVLLYCVGRDGNSKGLGLENVGIQPNERGLIPVNSFFQTSMSHIYAIGDVVGFPALASTSMEQGRQAIRHAYGVAGPKGDTAVLPFAIYSIPEVSYIGATEEELVAAGTEYVAGRGRYELNPRGQIIDDTGGLLKLLFEKASMRLLGVHIVGTGASELIHTGQAFLYDGTDATQIAETLFNYPTLSDLYRHASLDALMQANKLDALMAR